MERKPEWLRKTYKRAPDQEFVKDILKELKLNTICHEAKCPNSIECFSKKAATFMILGINCTRNCRFCNVTYEHPHQVDPQEPEALR